MVPFGNFGWNFGIGFGWLIVIVSLLLVVFAIVQLVRTMSSDKEPDVCDEKPSDALKRRYAKGEITKEEFEQKQTDLEAMDKKAA